MNNNYVIDTVEKFNNIVKKPNHHVTWKGITSSPIKDDKYITKELVRIRNDKNLPDESRKVVNKLLGDTKLRKKLRVILSSKRSIACIYMSNIICGNGLIHYIKKYDGLSILVKKSKYSDIIDELNYLKNNKDSIIIYFAKDEDNRFFKQL